MDIISKKRRSEIMAKIGSKNTKPEIAVRKMLFALGFRFRLHSPKLPGKPDIVLPKYKTVIFVHGCFWHHHKGCKRSNIPKTNKDYWLPKIEKNVERDKKHKSALRKNGWKVAVVWECQVKDLDKVAKRLLAKYVY